MSLDREKAREVLRDAFWRREVEPIEYDAVLDQLAECVQPNNSWQLVLDALKEKTLKLARIEDACSVAVEHLDRSDFPVGIVPRVAVSEIRAILRGES